LHCLQIYIYIYIYWNSLTFWHPSFTFKF